MQKITFSQNICHERVSHAELAHSFLMTSAQRFAESLQKLDLHASIALWGCCVWCRSIATMTQFTHPKGLDSEPVTLLRPRTHRMVATQNNGLYFLLVLVGGSVGSCLVALQKLRSHLDNMLSTCWKPNFFPFMEESHD